MPIPETCPVKSGLQNISRQSSDLAIAITQLNADLSVCQDCAVDLDTCPVLHRFNS